jgi:hypothetical protein
MNINDELYRALPNTLSTEAAAQLLECLYAIAQTIESRYFAQLRQRHPSPNSNDDQLPLWDSDPPF